MCAIVGLLRAPGERVDVRPLRAMAAAVAHRGPDDEGFHLDGNLGLGHRRLSILDLSAAGHQPMSNEDGSVWVVYNGQLFDFAPRRAWLEARGHRFRSRTDTEILVHLYEEKGEDLLDDLDGMFAFALWDARRRRLLLARDRLGIKPLYYVDHDGGWAFASELKALCALPGFHREIDPLALVQYLYQSSVPGDTSILSGVRKVAPGECVVIENGAARARRYWTLADDEATPPAPFAEVCASFASRLTAAVRSHLVADVPVGTFLSGGLDSTAVTKAARDALGGLHTFTVRFEGPAAIDEGQAAAEVAAALGTVHHEVRIDHRAFQELPAMVRHADEPFAISSAVALYHLSRFAREHVKVVLTGDGADEILAGYPWRHEPERGAGASAVSFLSGLALTGARSRRGAQSGGPGLAAQATARLGRLFAHPDERYAETVSAFTPEEMDALLAPDLRPLGERGWVENPVRLSYSRQRTPDAVNRRLRADLATTLVDEMLTKVDRMTMASGLEARVPFLDRALVEWAFRQPGRYKVRRGVGKRLLRQALARSLPAVARRGKQGFSAPLGAWMRGPLRSLLTDTLAPSVVRRRGLFRPEAVEKLISAHLAGAGDHSRKLFTLVALEIWLAEQARPERPREALPTAISAPSANRS